MNKFCTYISNIIKAIFMPAFIDTKELEYHKERHEYYKKEHAELIKKIGLKAREKAEVIIDAKNTRASKDALISDIYAEKEQYYKTAQDYKHELEVLKVDYDKLESKYSRLVSDYEDEHTKCEKLEKKLARYYKKDKKN